MADALVYQQMLNFVSEYFGLTSQPEAERKLSSSLSDMGIVVSYVAISLTLLWLTTRSVLLRHAPLIYVFASAIGLCGLGHLGRLVRYPAYFQLSIDFLSATVSITAAIMFVRGRHRILSAIYQFKYALGMLRNLEKIDEDNRA